MEHILHSLSIVGVYLPVEKHTDDAVLLPYIQILNCINDAPSWELVNVQTFKAHQSRFQLFCSLMLTGFCLGPKVCPCTASGAEGRRTQLNVTSSKLDRDDSWDLKVCKSAVTIPTDSPEPRCVFPEIVSVPVCTGMPCHSPSSEPSDLPITPQAIQD